MIDGSDSMSKSDEKISYWMELSNYDLETAKAMLKTKRFLYVGFMCHQAIEKSLKSFYIYKRKIDAPYTHNLAYLAKESGIYIDFNEYQRDLLDIVEPLNIEARYPGDKNKLLDSLTSEKCDGLIIRTEELVKWIENMLSK